MSFQIERDEPTLAALARLIAEQSEKLEAEGRAADAAPAAFIHKARVRAKRIRAALRLATPALGDKTRRRADRWWRDAARLLSEVRDASAQTEALEALQPALTERVDAAGVRALSARIRLQHRLSGVHRREAGAIRAFLDRLEARSVDPLAAADKAPPGMMREGLEASYRAARREMRGALREETPDAFHEWRKRVKSHGLQLKALQLVFPMISERVSAVRDLAECLGAIQDVAVLQKALETGVGEGIDPRIAGALLAERKAMQASAVEQGEALFGEKAKAWARRALGPGALGRGEPDHGALDRQPAEPDL